MHAPSRILSYASIAIACVACGGGSGGPPITVVAAPPASAPSAAVAAPDADAGLRCEGGNAFEMDGRAYCVREQPTTWKTAERRCADQGGQLVTLDTEAKSEALRAVLGSPLGAARAVWMGLRKPRPGRWEWVTGEALGASGWGKGEPNDYGGNESCAEWRTADGTWNDTRCDLVQGFLCQAIPLPSNKGNPFSCPGRAFSIGGTRYCLYNETQASFVDAEKECEGRGGALAVLRTAEEDQALRKALVAKTALAHVWIGFTDAGHEGQWSWASGGQGAFNAWREGEPNNFGEGEDCGELWIEWWNWNDLSCKELLPSICEGRPPR